MALTESTIEDKIEVVGDHKHVQVRTARVIYDDGTEISRSFSRHVLAPCTKSGDTWSNTDITGESTEVQASAMQFGLMLFALHTRTHVDAQET